MKKYILASFALVSVLASAQETPFKFKELVNNAALPIISQGKTGTCWSFSTTSFLESEVKRLTGKDIDHLKELIDNKEYDNILKEMNRTKKESESKQKNYAVRVRSL